MDISTANVDIFSANEHNAEKKDMIINQCEFCEKIFSCYKSRWRHEKICSKKLEFEKEQKLLKIIEELTEEIVSLKKIVELDKNKPQNVMKNTNNSILMNNSSVKGDLNNTQNNYALNDFGKFNHHV